MNSKKGIRNKLRNSSLLRIISWIALLGWFVISVLFVTGISVFSGVVNSADSSRSVAILTPITAAEAQSKLSNFPTDLVAQCSTDVTIGTFLVEAPAQVSEENTYEGGAVDEIVVTGSRISATTSPIEELLNTLNPGAQVAAVGARYATQEASRYTASYSANLSIGSFYKVSLTDPTVGFDDVFNDLWKISFVPTCILMERYSGINELSVASSILYKIDVSNDRQSIRFRPVHMTLNRAQAKSDDSLINLEIVNGVSHSEYDEYEESYYQVQEKVDVLNFDLRIGEAWSIDDAESTVLDSVLSKRIDGESDWMLVPKVNEEVMNQCIDQRRDCEFGSIKFRTTVTETGAGQSVYSRIAELL